MSYNISRQIGVATFTLVKVNYRSQLRHCSQQSLRRTEPRQSKHSTQTVELDVIGLAMWSSHSSERRPGRGRNFSDFMFCVYKHKYFSLKTGMVCWRQKIWQFLPKLRDRPADTIGLVARLVFSLSLVPTE